jgi:hypothetical protein
MRVFLWLALLSAACNAYTFFVKAQTEQCFMDEVQRGERVLATFAVESGGFLDIDVKILGPDMKVVYLGERETEGDIQFFAKTTGMYRLCFGNSMSTVTGKVVNFKMYVGNALMEQDAASKKHLDPLEKAIAEMKVGIRGLRDHQNYMKKREQRHRLTVDSTNSRALFWNLMETVGMVGVFGFQLYMIRRSFEHKERR